VGVDATSPSADGQFDAEKQAVAPETNPQNGNWVPGNAPSQALRWAVEGIAKAGTLSIIGVYPPQMDAFPIGMAMNKNLTVNMGNCNHRKYIPKLVELTRSGAVDPAFVLSNLEGVTDAISAYEAFDKRQPGWLKVELEPAA
jgi:threonine dehydrogenase-like Zn-dependent dehydrogenase